VRPIEGTGTSEGHWLGWLARAGLPGAVLPAVLPGAVLPDAVPTGAVPLGAVLPGAETRRAVVLAAHPDDEVLGAGGLLHRLARTGWQVDVVWASDGEASHPHSSAVTPVELARLRRQESLAAREVLGVHGTTRWLGLPDSAIGEHETVLRDAVADLVADADLVLAPWHADGHPDHEACGRVALELAARDARPVWELPIWAWHWGEAGELAPRWPHARLVHLGPQEQHAKAAAVQAFTTQVHPLGDGPGDAPVLPPSVLARFARPVEVVLCNELLDRHGDQAAERRPRERRAG
jgi:LmbE family N-acetylglucosaminyl deacetylase